MAERSDDGSCAGGDVLFGGRLPPGLPAEKSGWISLPLSERLALNKEIAGRFFLSRRTVDMHVGNILDRLDCRSRAEVARKAAELGLLS